MDEIEDFYHFTGPARLDKAVNSLLGILTGIAADSKVTDEEIGFLVRWVERHQEYRDRHPFNELLPVLAEVLADGVLTAEEHADLLWLCERLQSTDYYAVATANMQRLHGILAGVAADGVITIEELRGLSAWLLEHEGLKRCWPYDEVDGLVTGMLADGHLDEREHQMLLSFFSEFGGSEGRRTIERPLVDIAGTLRGVCAVCPEVRIPGSLFCFTGESARFSRKQLTDLVRHLGGLCSTSVTRKLDYLVVGAESNPCWAYACYGRKVEKAVDLRKAGSRLLVIHENDFHDAVADSRR